MPTYISLIHFTEQGIKNVKDSPKRIDAAREAYRKAGGELKAIYATMGKVDLIAIVDLPDDATAARASLALGALGNVRSETLKAFTEDEYRKIVSTMQ